MQKWMLGRLINQPGFCDPRAAQRNYVVGLCNRIWLRAIGEKRQARCVLYFMTIHKHQGEVKLIKEGEKRA